MDRDHESQYLLDMTRCQPADAIGTDFAKGRWTAVDFSIAAGAGKMLFCGPDTEAPPVRLDPGVSGWHHIFVGTHQRPRGRLSYIRLVPLSGSAP